MQIVRNCNEDRINDKKKLALFNPARILYAQYFCSLCLCFVGFLCAQVSCKIRKKLRHFFLTAPSMGGTSPKCSPTGDPYYIAAIIYLIYYC